MEKSQSCRGQKRWRRDSGYIGKMELPDRRWRGRPKMRSMEVVKVDVQGVSVRKDNDEDLFRWAFSKHRG